MISLSYNLFIYFKCAITIKKIMLNLPFSTHIVKANENIPNLWTFLSEKHLQFKHKTKKECPHRWYKTSKSHDQHHWKWYLKRLHTNNKNIFLSSRILLMYLIGVQTSTMLIWTVCGLKTSKKCLLKSKGRFVFKWWDT
jgi:hypothetical protein